MDPFFDFAGRVFYFFCQSHGLSCPVPVQLYHGRKPLAVRLSVPNGRILSFSAALRQIVDVALSEVAWRHSSLLTYHGASPVGSWTGVMEYRTLPQRHLGYSFISPEPG